ncbi:helix-turn-helix domain-containing protein [Lactobacillus johnsonii]|uniref:helix-turn-helix domain-containing protein n=1 Tax=Lactobacillus johnsonii TaxID=33959 RepID=UPI00388E4071
MAKIKKIYDRGFTVIDNLVLNDELLSWKAKGLFCYLWSQADEWNFYVKEVAKHSKGGKDQVTTGLEELEKAGYLLRNRRRNELGQLKNNEWLLSDHPKEKWKNIAKKRTNKKKAPMTDFPAQENPVQGNPAQENPALTSTNLNKYQHKQIKKINKSLSKEERERDVNAIEILITYLNHCAEEWRRPLITFSDAEINKMVKAVHGKDTRALKEAAEKTVIYGEQYPQGYLLTCIKNLPEEDQ